MECACWRTWPIAGGLSPLDSICHDADNARKMIAQMDAEQAHNKKK
jgi:hypothetical protein